MAFKRLGIAVLVLGFVFASTAEAKRVFYTLAAGSGAQLHIGNGLPLPVQTPATAFTGMNFPPLLVGKIPGVVRVSGTNAKTGLKRNITGPPGVLRKVGSQKTVGVFDSNNSLYAVATNLTFAWPTAAGAKFSESGVRNVSEVKVFNGAAPGNKITYSDRVAGKRFGGPGRFSLRPAYVAPGATPTGLLSDAGVTVYAVAVPGPGFPPCQHPKHGGTAAGAACVAAIIEAQVTGALAHGAAPGVTVTTDGANRFPGTGPGHFGNTPRGTLIAFSFNVTPSGFGPTNDAESTGYPWTTAMITIQATQTIDLSKESFTISGADSRTAGGAGTIQLVSGALSKRPLSGTNANRAWLKLILEPNPQVPSMSALGLAATAGLMLLTAGYAMRRRIFA